MGVMCVIGVRGLGVRGLCGVRESLASLVSPASPRCCQTETAIGGTTTHLTESNAEIPLKPEALSGRAVWSLCVKAMTTLQKQLILLPHDDY